MFMNPWEYAASIEAGKPPVTEAKPVVHFHPLFGGLPLEEGRTARVVPVDHPAAYLNGEIVTTSYIVAVNPDGSFETRNTRYVPFKENNA